MLLKCSGKKIELGEIQCASGGERKIERGKWGKERQHPSAPTDPEASQKRPNSNRRVHVSRICVSVV